MVPVPVFALSLCGKLRSKYSHILVTCFKWASPYRALVSATAVRTEKGTLIFNSYEVCIDESGVVNIKPRSYELIYIS